MNMRYRSVFYFLLSFQTKNPLLHQTLHPRVMRGMWWNQLLRDWKVSWTSTLFSNLEGNSLYIIIMIHFIILYTLFSARLCDFYKNLYIYIFFNSWKIIGGKRMLSSESFDKKKSRKASEQEDTKIQDRSPTKKG